MTIKWRKDFVGNFSVKKEGNAKYSSVTLSIPDVLHGEIGRKITPFYSQIGIRYICQVIDKKPLFYWESVSLVLPPLVWQ